MIDREFSIYNQERSMFLNDLKVNASKDRSIKRCLYGRMVDKRRSVMKNLFRKSSLGTRDAMDANVLGTSLGPTRNNREEQ